MANKFTYEVHHKYADGTSMKVSKNTYYEAYKFAELLKANSEDNDKIYIVTTEEI